MKLRTQILIDKYVGLPIAYAANLAIRIAGKILRPDHNLERDFKTIAVAKYKGLGSIVQCTPLLRTLRARYKSAHIIFITTEGNRPLLEKIDSIDEILTVEDRGLLRTIISIKELLFTLWKRRVGVFLDLEIYSNTSSLITSFSIARNRMGYYLRSSNYRMGMYTHMMYYNIQSPVSEVYLQFARLLNCREIISDLYPLNGKGLLPAGLPERYIVVNVNASDLRIERRWPASSFIKLIEGLRKRCPEFQIILIGNKQEKPYVDQIYNRLNDHSGILNFAGATSFDELIGTLEKASLIITNDTGPMHLGFALGVKTVALFGPCSPAQYGGHRNAAVIYKNVYCSPCVHEFRLPPCNGDNQCMKLITPEEVTGITLGVLSGNSPGGPGGWQQVVYRVPEGEDGNYALGIVSR